jgi:hypothetical protein
LRGFFIPNLRARLELHACLRLQHASAPDTEACLRDQIFHVGTSDQIEITRNRVLQACGRKAESPVPMRSTIPRKS